MILFDQIIQNQEENQTIKQDNNDLNNKISLLEKQKEDQEKLTRLLEQEKNDLNNKVKGLMLQIEGINNFSTEKEKEKIELIIKLGELKHQSIVKSLIKTYDILKIRRMIFGQID